MASNTMKQAELERVDDQDPEKGLASRVVLELHEAERKAWMSLSRYKFWMFGYYAARWVFLSRLQPKRLANPFRCLVEIARLRTDERGALDEEHIER